MKHRCSQTGFWAVATWCWDVGCGFQGRRSVGPVSLLGETGPTELLSWKPHPISQHQVATALNPVWEHLCSTCAYSFYVWTSRMCPQVPASLLYVALAYERLPRGALLSDSGEIWTRHCRWDLLFPFSRPLSQVTILLLANLWFILPLNHVLISPYFISMPLHSVEKLDTVLIVCLKAPP